MKFIPILFSRPMVQAIVQGRKTQTRRMQGLKIINENPDNWNFRHVDENGIFHFESKDGTEGFAVSCPYGQPGGVLWVRETWRKYCPVDENGNTDFEKAIIEFKADNPPLINLVDGDGFQEWTKSGAERYIPWKPSIFMPKAACRLFLRVKSVRVERLQDISYYDAPKEGMEMKIDSGDGVEIWRDYMAKNTDGYDETYFTDAKPSFISLWQKINGESSWGANPWVWVVEFEHIDKPENFV